jgi:F-type H+-transporting ATPase subunit delta
MLINAFPDLETRVRNFLVLLVRRDRLGLLPDVVATFHAMLNELRGIEVVEVTTASPLEQGERGLVADRLAAYLNRRVELETLVDPEIIGGVIARIGDRVLDGSVRGRLDRLRVALARPA